MITLSDCEKKYDAIVMHLREELQGIRTGRAHAALVENIKVEAYGSTMALKGTAQISIPDARTILISPWDTSIMKDIERALQQADLGCTPINDGSQLRLALPVMTEENRRQLSKLVGQKAEQAKISLRGVRDEAREEVSKGEKQKELTEDDRYTFYKKLDELTRRMTDAIDELAKAKEQEIMSVS